MSHTPGYVQWHVRGTLYQSLTHDLAQGYVPLVTHLAIEMLSMVVGLQKESHLLHVPVIVGVTLL